MNDHDFETSFRAWSLREASDPASGDLRGRVGAIPSTTPHQRGWLPPILTGRFQTMFSATKFVAAGVIVALFGGFLLAGMLTTPQEGEMAPAAVTESPSPMTTDELLSGMVTEEVEPGVFRVINDGVRNLSPMGEDSWKRGVVAGDDGNTWLVRDRWFARLGDELQHDLPAVKSTYGGLLPHDIAFAPDGTIWAITVDRGDDGLGILRSYDGDRWKRRSPVQGVDVADVEVGPDGTVWASWTETVQKGKTFVGTVSPDGLERVAVTDGDPGLEGLIITHDGDPMLKLDSPYRDGGPIHASRYADGSWQEVRVDGGGITALGSDGSVWVLPAHQPPHVDDDGRTYHVTPLDTLTRFDGEEQQVWGPDDGMLALALGYKMPGDMRVAPDGGLWVSYPLLSTVASDNHNRNDESVYDGVARFDGQTWQRYLRGYLVNAMDIAPDGSVWLSAGRKAEGLYGPDTYDLYVITPEAVGTGD